MASSKKKLYWCFISEISEDYFDTSDGESSMVKVHLTIHRLFSFRISIELKRKQVEKRPKPRNILKNLKLFSFTDNVKISIKRRTATKNCFWDVVDRKRKTILKTNSCYGNLSKKDLNKAAKKEYSLMRVATFY